MVHFGHVLVFPNSVKNIDIQFYHFFYVQVMKIHFNQSVDMSTLIYGTFALCIVKPSKGRIHSHNSHMRGAGVMIE